MIDYDAMTDPQINKAVAIYCGFELHSEDEISCWVTKFISAGYGPRHVVSLVSDYCNNWADAGPIIVENRITIEAETKGGLWNAYHEDFPANFVESGLDDDPLHAAMIVFLKMKEAE
tara:strand:- start:1458 stop:1808 length:351 start_codon:yes stop_codon:yes gene_type:complete